MTQPKLRESLGGGRGVDVASPNPPPISPTSPLFESDRQIEIRTCPSVAGFFLKSVGQPPPPGEGVALVWLGGWGGGPRNPLSGVPPDPSWVGVCHPAPPEKDLIRRLPSPQPHHPAEMR